MMHSFSFKYILLLCLVFSCVYVTCEEQQGDEATTAKHPANNVLERKLVGEKQVAKLILKENKNYAADVERKNFKGDTLAYVTPWNNHGYDIAKIFNKKFTFVSPVWIQVKLGQRVHLDGLHDIDQGWVADVRRGSDSKIVPRVWFEGMHSPQALQFILSIADKITNMLVGLCEEHKFDGLVLDGFSQAMMSEGDELEDFLRKVAEALHEKNKIIILVVAPYEKMFGAKEFASYSNFIDKFSVNTYDYSSPEKPGPLAPLSWVENVIQVLKVGENAHKLMMGLNFYGYDYIPAEKTGNAIIGETFLQILKKFNSKLSWDSSSAEHFLKYSENQKSHLVYFPTLKSVHERIKLAEELGVSIVLWEIGQGLDYFYDLL